jgi:hypothetical protein
MTQPWQSPVVYFVLFNLLGAPLAGRAIWLIMQGLNAEGGIVAAVALSLVGAISILLVNSYLSWWAGRAGVPRKGLMAMWLITGGTFVLTIGFGTFSPINLVIGLIRMAAV